MPYTRERGRRCIERMIEDGRLCTWELGAGGSDAALLEKGGDVAEKEITEDVVMAAENEEVTTLLPDKRGEEV